MSTLHHPGHETTDAGTRNIAIVGFSLAVCALFVYLIVYGVFRYLEMHPPTAGIANPLAKASVPPEPRVEEHPAIQLEQLRAEEDRILSTYGWVNKNAGVVRIPIDRAMDLALQRGFPVRKEAPKK